MPLMTATNVALMAKETKISEEIVVQAFRRADSGTDDFVRMQMAEYSLERVLAIYRKIENGSAMGMGIVRYIATRFYTPKTS